MTRRKGFDHVARSRSGTLRQSSLIMLAAFTILTWSNASSFAACDWIVNTDFAGSLGYSGGTVLALRHWPDAAYSEDLIIAGSFENLAGKPAADGVVLWKDGLASPLDDGIDVSGSNQVTSLAVFNDGLPSLYAAGLFTSASGVPVSNIAAWRWNGTEFAWSPLGSAGAGPNGKIRAMAVFDDGSGPALYVGGDFTDVPQLPLVVVPYLAKWDGKNWYQYGGPQFDGPVRALGVYDDGSGAKLYIGGDFTERLVTWDGTFRMPLKDGPNGSVHSMAIHNDGNGYALYLGGEFTGPVTGGARIVRYDGTWESLGQGLSGTVRTLASHDGSLIAGGDFLTALPSQPVNYVAEWTNGVWAAMDGGFQQGPVNAIASNDCQLFVGGDLSHVDGAESVAKWESLETWTALPFGNKSISDATGYGSDEIIVGNFDELGTETQLGNVARWIDGTLWDRLGFGVDGKLNAAVSDGSDLYVGGGFGQAINIGFAGPIPVDAGGVARWDGTAWSDLDGGILVDVDGLGFQQRQVRGLAVGGGRVYAGGKFSESTTGTPIDNLGYFENDAWHQLEGGVPSPVVALAHYDSALYVAGSFTYVVASNERQVPAFGIAKYNENTESWDTSLGSGLGASGQCYTFHVDGSDLIIGGDFLEADGLAVENIVRWDGTSFSALGDGLPGPVRTINRIDGKLHAGGDFNQGDLAHVAYFDDATSEWVGLGATCSPNGNVTELREFPQGIAMMGQFTSVGDGCDALSASDLAVAVDTGPLSEPTRGTVSAYLQGEQAVPGLSPSLHIGPNPAGAVLDLNFDLPTAGRVRIEVFDASGRLRTVVLDEYLVAGRHLNRLNTRDPAGDIKSGVYFARLQWEGQTVHQKFVVLDR